MKIVAFNNIEKNNKMTIEKKNIDPMLIKKLNGHSSLEYKDDDKNNIGEYWMIIILLHKSKKKI